MQGFWAILHQSLAQLAVCLLCSSLQSQLFALFQQALIIFGLPKANLSERAAEWHTLTSQIIEPTDLQSKYGNWYQTQVRGEIVQISGRPRAHLKPDVLVEVTFLAGDAMNERDLDTLAKIPRL